MPLPGWGIFKNRVMGTMVGTAAGMAAADALSPAFRELVYEMERQLTNRVLTPAQLAELVAVGLIGQDAGADAAAASGYDRDRFAQMVAIAGSGPGTDNLLQLRRRGAIDDDAVTRGLRQGGVRREWQGELRTLLERLLDPDTLAEASARGLTSGPAAQREADLNGISAARFELLERLAARPPTTGELLDLVNRGDVDEGRARRALRDAGVREEWVDELLRLRFHLAPPTDLVRFAVREAYTPEIVQRFRLDEDLPARFVTEAARLGIDPELARLYWRAHWDLPSPTQGFEMFHRAIIDRATLQLLLRALDVMPFWRDRLIELAYRVPGRIDLRRMFRFDVIDRGRLVRGYLDLGYSPEVAAELARFAQREKLEPERDLTKSELVGLYEESALERAPAVEALRGLGYDEREAGLILGLADARRARRLRAQLIRVVRGRYLRRALEEDEARRRLTAAGVPAPEQEQNLELWRLEREQEEPESVRHVSEAQMRAAWRRGQVSESRYRAHLQALRLPLDEQDILVQLYRPEAPPPRTRDLTRADLIRAYTKGILSRQQVTERLLGLGYDADEVELIFTLAEQTVSV